VVQCHVRLRLAEKTGRRGRRAQRVPARVRRSEEAVSRANQRNSAVVVLYRGRLTSNRHIV